MLLLQLLLPIRLPCPPARRRPTSTAVDCTAATAAMPFQSKDIGLLIVAFFLPPLAVSAAAFTDHDSGYVWQ